MFIQRRQGTGRLQKQRGPRWAKAPMQLANPIRGWAGLVALGPGFMTLKLVEQLYTKCKQASCYPKQPNRFWVTVQCSSPVTRKSLNVRMGKGKGPRRALQARVNLGAWLVRLARLRHGAILKLARYASVRCSFKLKVAGLGTSIVGEWHPAARPTRMQPRFIGERRESIRDTLAQLRRPALSSYIKSIFRWRFVIPRAVWVAPRSKITVRAQVNNLIKRRALSFSPNQSAGVLRQICQIHGGFAQQVITLSKLDQAGGLVSSEPRAGSTANRQALAISSALASYMSANLKLPSTGVLGTVLAYRQVVSYLLTRQLTASLARLPGAN